MNMKRAWADVLAPVVELSVDEILPLLEVPPRSEMGDLAFPCFQLAKVRRMAPPKIAQDVAASLTTTELPEWLDRVTAEGPYVNVSFARVPYIREIIKDVLDAGTQYGADDEGITDGTPDTVLVEYSSPNIAKPFHVGHAFSTIVGHALTKIHHHLGYDVKRLNYVGDYGTQFGKLIVAYGLWCDAQALEEDPIKELTRIYVKFHQEAEDQPELEVQAREAFKRLEQGGEEELALWQRFRDLSIESFQEIYTRLGVTFDDYRGESFYSKLTPRVIEELQAKGLLVESEGAQVVDLEDLGMPPVLILKSDGTTIYASRDIASVLYRDAHYQFSKNMYVVGIPQTLHFKQVFAVVKKMGYTCADRCVHVPFGTVKFPEGKMSTRDGDVVLLNDLLEEAVAKTLQIIRQTNADRTDPMSEEAMRATAETVGLGAVVHTFVRQSRERDIIFSWDDMLDFEGDTGPYLQYTYARGRSILRRAEQIEDVRAQADIDTETTIDERSEATLEATFALAKAIADLPEAIKAARRMSEPSMITRQVSTIARAFNSFYHRAPILKATGETRDLRLQLTHATCVALRTGLDLVGIGVVERM